MLVKSTVLEEQVGHHVQTEALGNDQPTLLSVLIRHAVLTHTANQGENKKLNWEGPVEPTG